MAKYNLKIYPAALADLSDIIDYLNTLSPETATSCYDMIVEKIGSLAENPERCPIAKDTQLRLRGYRTLFVNKYIVFYIVENSTVKILRILHARRQYERII